MLPKNVLIIDDDPTVIGPIETALGRINIQVIKACDLDTALYIFNQRRFDVVIVELEFGPLPGLAMIQKWRKHEVHEKRLTGFIGMTSNQKTGTQQALLKELGDIELVAKPVNPAFLQSLLIKACEHKQRALDNFGFEEKFVTPFVKEKRYDRAIEEVMKKKDTLGPRAWTMLLDLYGQAGNHQQLLKTAESMLVTDASNIIAINAAGKALMNLGKFAEAKVYLEKADKAAPGNIERITAMADLYLDLKDPDKSVGKMKEIIDVYPEKADTKFDMFAKLYDAGFDEQAINFGKSNSKPAEIVKHYNNKGVLLSKEGNKEKAVEEYERALKFFPKFKDNFRIHYNIALAYINKKDLENLKKAKDSLIKALALEPKFDKAKTALDWTEAALIKLGDVKKAG